MTKQALIVFDADDTLWATEVLYDRARSEIARLVEWAGLDPLQWDRDCRRLDLERVQRSGFAWHRFPGSCALAVLAQHRARRLRTIGLALLVIAIAMRVFLRRAQVDPAARTVLASLSDQADLVLATKGQRWIQRRRIRASGLRESFTMCLIVDDKDSSTFAAIAARYPDHPVRISVGNSPASDLLPAQAVGYLTVLVESHAWTHETRSGALDVSPTAIASSLASVEPIALDLVAEPTMSLVSA
ncbi:haloacid dehalogenase [Nocardioides baekrokdamisoli]|uniref:Haloacid dehalogenase n=1 Tax=Nocardioides baekrokdamisoli TaxID=1804624 RepID=A0A3G9J152_9ACTN|nr:HAD family hydrolase [Nocardioides baekrokdamisoli]BBH17194.1 haloacid dehalogenase [Nocardioides baekrokdamisoli]